MRIGRGLTRRIGSSYRFDSNPPTQLAAGALAISSGEIPELVVFCRVLYSARAFLDSSDQESLTQERVMEAMWRDVRGALRGTRRSRTTRALIVLMIAFAVGMSTAAFSIVRTIAQRRLPFPDSDRLVVISHLFPDGSPGRVTLEMVEDWRRRSASFVDIAAICVEEYNATTAGGASRIKAALVTPNFFSVMGVPPLLGRAFTGEEGREGSPRVTVLSELFWRDAYGATSTVPDRRLGLGSRLTAAARHEIVGVAPALARLHVLPRPDVFLAVVAGSSSDPGKVYVAIGRLRENASARQASAELSALIRHGGPTSHFPSPGAQVVPLADAEFGPYLRHLQILSTIVLLILLMACVSIAGLLIVDAAERRLEFAVRMAVGATRWQLVRQLLAEHLVIAATGAGLGLLVAAVGTRAILALEPPDLPGVEDVRLSGTVAMFAVAISLIMGIVSGVLPAWLVSSVQPDQIVRPVPGRSRRGATPRDLLLLLQLSTVVAMTIGAAVTARSFWRLVQVPLGIDTRAIVVAGFTMGTEHLREPDRYRALVGALLNDAALLQEVEGVALCSPLPGSRQTYGLFLPNGERLWALRREVSPGYFSLLRIPLVEGRRFERDDPPSAVVVNDVFRRHVIDADRFSPAAPGRSGQHLPRGLTLASISSRQVVGVAGNTWEGGQTTGGDPVVYTNILAGEYRYFRVWLLARSRQSTGATVGGLRALAKRVAPDIPVEFTTLDRHFAEGRRQLRFYTVILAVCGAAGLALAALGVFAATRRMVEERRRELAVRLAVGAPTRALYLLLLRRVGLLAGVAVFFGQLAGVATSRVLHAVLFDISPSDALSFVVASVIVAIVALLAACQPARNAMATDPLAALRES